MTPVVSSSARVATAQPTDAPPSARSASRAVSWLVVRTWRNVLRHRIGIPRRLFPLAIGLVVAGIAMLWVAAIGFLTPLFTAMIERAVDSQAFVALVWDNLGVVAVLVLGGTLLASPDVSALEELLAALPVSSRSRHLGHLRPIAGVTLGTLGILFTPVAIALFRASPGTVTDLGVFAALAIQIVWAVLWAALLVTGLLVVTTRTLDLPRSLARLASVALAGFVTTLVLVADIARTGLGADTLALGPVNLPVVVLGAEGVGLVLAVAGLAVGIMAMALAVARLARGLPRREVVRGPGTRAKSLRGSIPGTVLADVEWRLAARHAENRLFLAFCLVFTVAGVVGLVVFVDQPGMWLSLLAPMAALVGPMFAANAHGRLRAARWSWRVAPVSSRRVAWIQFGIAVMFSVAVSAGLLAIVVAAGWRPAGLSDVLGLAAMATVAAAWTHLCGVVLPYEPDAPLTGALTIGASLLAGVPLLYGLFQLGLGEGGLVGVLLATGVVAVIGVLSTRQVVRDVAA